MRIQPDAAIVKLFFDVFRENMGMVPIPLRNEVFNLCKLHRYSLLERIVEINQINPDIYFICDGVALDIKTQKDFNKILKKEKVVNKEQALKDKLTSSKAFTSLATVGWIFLKYIMRNENIMSKIQKRIDNLDSTELSHHM